MKVDLLEQFKKNVAQIRFNPKIEDSFHFNKDQIKSAVNILIDFFSKNYFIVEQGFKQIDNSGLKARNNWIIYHLAQSANSIGSILLILEISGIIRYYDSRSDSYKNLLESKLKKKNKAINDSELRSNLLELYFAFILEKVGFKVNIDCLINKNKPLDILLEFDNEKILVECKTINETQLENELIDIISFCMNSYSALLEKHKNNRQVLCCLPVSLFIKVTNKSILNDAKKCFKKRLKDYQKDIQSMAYGNNKINVPYTAVKNGFSICIEPFKEGLFEAYSGFFNKTDVGIRFKLFTMVKGNKMKVILKVDCIVPNIKKIEDRIKKSIEDKREQHKNVQIKKRIFILEYENYSGIRIPFDLNDVSTERIKGLIKDNEIVCIIHKDSTKQENISRKMMVISKNEKDNLAQKLKHIELNPFININKT